MIDLNQLRKDCDDRLKKTIIQEAEKNIDNPERAFSNAKFSDNVAIVQCEESINAFIYDVFEYVCRDDYDILLMMMMKSFDVCLQKYTKDYKHHNMIVNECMRGPHNVLSDYLRVFGKSKEVGEDAHMKCLIDFKEYCFEKVDQICFDDKVDTDQPSTSP